MTGRLVGILRKEKPRAVPETLGHARVSKDEGIAGDYRGRTPDRQVTVMAREDWTAACRELGRELPWTTRRANLCVEGVDLPQRAGAQLKIGKLILEVMQETDPCSVMEAQAVGLRAALAPDWRGGVSCRVIEAADIALGDAVELL